jgi:serine/threonine-protein kinase
MARYVSSRASQETQVDDAPVEAEQPGFATTAFGPADVRDTPRVKPPFPTQHDDDEEEEDPWIGRTLSNVYRVERRIGEGGMGTVYEARHVHLQKSFAIKVLLDTIASKGNAVERLRQEAMAAAKIDHENIVDVVNFDRTEGGAVYIVMELLKGESLAECIGRGPIELYRALPITYQIARALQAAHEHGIVHRDLKPENVFLTEKGGRTLVKVLDFGISKIRVADAEQVRMTRTGQLVGTPLYMSPEQARGETDVDRRVDVYALGVILYEMITGAPPFEGRNYFELLWKHGNEPPPSMRERNPNVYFPDELEAVVARALAKQRDDRFATMEELERALVEAVPDVAPLGSLPSLPPERPSSPTASRTASRPSAPVPLEARKAAPAEPSAAHPPATTTAELPLPTNKRGPMIALALVALAALGTGGYALSIGPEPTPAAERPASEPPPREAPPREAPPREPPAREPLVERVEPTPPSTPRVSLSLTSVPDGAEVHVGDRLLGTTPLVAPLAASDEPVALTFSREGFFPQTVSVIPAEGVAVPPVRLRRRRQATQTSTGADLPIKTGL